MGKPDPPPLPRTVTVAGPKVAVHEVSVFMPAIGQGPPTLGICLDEGEHLRLIRLEVPEARQFHAALGRALAQLEG